MAEGTGIDVNVNAFDINSDYFKLKSEGNEYFYRDDFEKAKESYEKAIACHPPNIILETLHNNLATIYAKEKNWDKLMEHVNEALKINPNDIKALFGRYRVYDATGRCNEALEDIINVCYTNLEDVMYLRNLDIAIMKASMIDADEFIKNRTVATRSKYGVNSYLKTFCCDPLVHWCEGKFPEGDEMDAVADNMKQMCTTEGVGDTANKICKGFAAALLDLSAHAYSKIMDYCTDELKEPDSKFQNEAHYLRGTFRFLSGYPDAEVLEDLEAVISSTSAGSDLKASAWIKRGEVFTLANDTAEMKRSFEKAQEIQPENVDGYISYCNSLMEIDQTKEAYAEIQKAVTLRPDFAYGVGVMCFMEFRNEVESDHALAPLGSLKSFLKYIAKFPLSPDMHVAFGYFFKDLHEPCAAYIEFERSIELDPDNLTYVVHKIMMCYEMTADAEKCVTDLHELLTKDEKNTAAYEAVATLHIAISDYDLALAAIEKGLTYAKARHEFMTLSILKKTAEVRKKMAVKYMTAHQHGEGCFPCLREEQMAGL